MELSPLTAVSPVDGRYHSKTEALADYFSEYAVIRYRVLIEIEYFIALSQAGLPQLPPVGDDMQASLRRIYDPEVFTPAEAAKVKEIEKTTNHDVKAVEYYIKARFDELGLGQYKEFIHFGLTSQDINNTAFPLMMSNAISEIIIPAYQRLHGALLDLAQELREVPMLARTHGQPASPTSMGKEIAVFVSRIEEQLEVLDNSWINAKFGGATGNFNAHTVAYPGIDWAAFGDKFLESLKLTREEFTTQISNYDNTAQICDNFARLNTIVIDLDRDIWQYISMGYFKQRIKEGEVGSSAMPHKGQPHRLRK